MFDNSGEKLKYLGKVIFIALSIGETLAAIIAAIYLESTTAKTCILCAFPFMALINYILALVMHGFGTIIDNVADIAEHFCDEDNNEQPVETELYSVPDSTGKTECPQCHSVTYSKEAGKCLSCDFRDLTYNKSE